MTIGRPAWGSLTESSYLDGIPWNGTDPLRALTGQPQKTVVNGKIVFCACPPQEGLDRNTKIEIGGAIMALGEFGVGSL